MEHTKKSRNSFDFHCPVYFATKESFGSYVGPHPKIEERPGQGRIDENDRLIRTYLFEVGLDDSEGTKKLLADEDRFSVHAEIFAKALKREICDPSYGLGSQLGRRVLEVKVEMAADDGSASIATSGLVQETLVTIETCEAN